MKWFIPLIVALFLSSCSVFAPPALAVQDAWVRAARISEITAADLNTSCICDVKTAALFTNVYLTIKNPTAQADQLLKAESADITRIEFRGASTASNLSAAPLDKIDLPARGTLSFAPGGYAMLLMGIKKDLKAGETLTMSLYFEKAGKVDLTLAVRGE